MKLNSPVSKTILLLVFTLCAIAVFAQNNAIDSLQKVLQTQKEDTNKLHTLLGLSSRLTENDPEQSINYAAQALNLSNKLNYSKGITASEINIGSANLSLGNYDEALKHFNKAAIICGKNGEKGKMAIIYNNIGLIYDYQSNYPEAIKNYSAALEIDKEVGSKTDIAIDYNNIAIVYQEQGNYPGALQNYFTALKFSEEVNDRETIARVLGNIGIVYMLQGNNAEALKNQLAALKIEEQLGLKRDVSLTLQSIGNIYRNESKYDEALKNYQQALKLAEETGDKFEIANCYSNIAEIDFLQDDYPGSIENHHLALQIFEELGNKEGIAMSYNSIGKANIRLKNFSEARTWLEKGLNISKEIGNVDGIKESYGGLESLDRAMGNYKEAYDHSKLYNLYRDSLFNQENTKKSVQIQMNYDFEKKEAITKAEKDKKDIRQRNIRNSILAGLGGMFVFSLIVFRQRNKISKEKKRSEELLLNILPSETAEELKQTGSAKAKSYEEVTVMFTDFKDFTQASEKLSAEELVKEINYCYSEFDKIISGYKIEKIKTIGDSYMCAGGLPVPTKTNAEDTVRAALGIQQFMEQLRRQREQQGQPFFELRIGVHTGPVVAGIVGIKKFAYDIWGDTVNIASRMQSSGEVGKVNISEATFELVKDKFQCSYRGKILAKNKGEIDMYFVN